MIWGYHYFRKHPYSSMPSSFHLLYFLPPTLVQTFERAMLTKMAVTALISHVTVALVETDAWPTAQLWMPSAAQAGWCIPNWLLHFLLVRCWNIHWHLTHRVLFFRLRSYLKPQVTHHVLIFRLRSYLKPQVLRFLLKFSYIHGSWLLNIIGAEGRTAPRAR